jgi:hypothetical protein
MDVRLRQININGIQTINKQLINSNTILDLQSKIMNLYNIPIDFQLLVYHYQDDDGDTVSDYLTYTYPNDEYTVQIFENILDMDTIDNELNIEFKPLIRNTDFFNRKLDIFFVDENRENFIVEKKTLLQNNIIFIEIYNMLDVLNLGLQLNWNEQTHKDFIKSYFPFLDVNKIFNHIIQIGQTRELDIKNKEIRQFYKKKIIDESMLINVDPTLRIQEIFVYTNELLLIQEHQQINILNLYQSLDVNEINLYILYKNKQNYKQKFFINILNNNTYKFIQKLLKPFNECCLLVYKIQDTLCYHIISINISKLYCNFYNYEYNPNDIENIKEIFNQKNINLNIQVNNFPNIETIELYFIPNYKNNIFNIRLFKQLIRYYDNKSKLIDFDFDKDSIEWMYIDVDNYNKDIHIKYVIKLLKSKNYRLTTIQDIISRLFNLNTIETINYVENFDDFVNLDLNIGVYVSHNRNRIILNNFNDLSIINKFLDYFFRILLLSENEDIVIKDVKDIKVSGNKINMLELRDNIVQAKGFVIDKRKCQKEKQPTILSRDQFENVHVGKDYIEEDDYIYKSNNSNSYAMLSKDRNFVFICDDNIKGRKSGFIYPGFTKEGIPCCTSTKNVNIRISEIRRQIHNIDTKQFDYENTRENMSKNISKNIINTDLIEMPNIINQMFQTTNIIDNFNIISNGFLLLQINPLQFYLNISKKETIETFYIEQMELLEDILLYNYTQIKLPNKYKSKQELLNDIQNKKYYPVDEYFLMYIFKIIYNINIIDYNAEQFICYDFNPNIQSTIRVKYNDKLYQVVFYNNNTLSCLFNNLYRINQYFSINDKLFSMNKIEQKYKILTQIMNNTGYINNIIIEYNNSKITIPIIPQYASIDYPIINIYLSSNIENILSFLDENNINRQDISLIGKNNIYYALETPIGIIFIDEIQQNYNLNTVINDFRLYNIMLDEDNTILENTFMSDITKILYSINIDNINKILNSNEIQNSFDKFINIYEMIKDLNVDDKTIVYFIKMLIQKKENLSLFMENINIVDTMQELSFSSLSELEKLLNLNERPFFYNTPEITLSNQTYTLDEIQIGGTIDISELMNISNQHNYYNNYYNIPELFWYSFENNFVDIKIIATPNQNKNTIHLFDKIKNKKYQYIDSRQRRVLLNSTYTINIPTWKSEIELLIDKIPKTEILKLELGIILFDNNGQLLIDKHYIRDIIKNKFSIYIFKNNKYYKLYYLNKSIFTFYSLPLILQYKLT